jgi:hypothetical protein
LFFARVVGCRALVFQPRAARLSCLAAASMLSEPRVWGWQRSYDHK